MKTNVKTKSSNKWATRRMSPGLPEIKKKTKQTQ